MLETYATISVFSRQTGELAVILVSEHFPQLICWLMYIFRLIFSWVYQPNGNSQLTNLFQITVGLLAHTRHTSHNFKYCVFVIVS